MRRVGPWPPPSGFWTWEGLCAVQGLAGPRMWGCVMSRSRGRTALSALPQLHPQALPPAGLQWSLRPRSLFAVS